MMDDKLLLENIKNIHIADSDYKGDKDNTAIEAENYSPLTLAYIGDAVFEILVRTRIIFEGNRPVNELNRISSSYVKASSQSKMYHKIKNMLTEEELAVLKRGRNAKSNTHAKNASISDYRHATGLEALFGYLYMKNNMDRIKELFNFCMKEN